MEIKHKVRGSGGKRYVVAYAPNVPQTKIAEFLKRTLVGETIQVDDKGDGMFLAGNMVNLYRVASVNPWVYVGSLQDMTPGQTRKIAKGFLKDIPRRKQ